MMHCTPYPPASQYPNHRSKPIYDYLIANKIADGDLIAKWKKPGYEFLCSLLAISTRSTNFGTNSVCRVPLRDRGGNLSPDVRIGCISCASCDVRGAPIWWNTPTSAQATHATAPPPPAAAAAAAAAPAAAAPPAAPAYSLAYF